MLDAPTRVDIHRYDTWASAQWQIWGSPARVVVTDPAVLPAAIERSHSFLADVQQACSRFDPDSELRQLHPQGSTAGIPVSSLLADLLRASLIAAERTDGAVDPTLGRDLSLWGYDRDLAELSPASGPDDLAGAEARYQLQMRSWPARSPRWREIRLEGTLLFLPQGTVLDLGASAKAYAADLLVAALHRQLGCGILVSLGGDLATAGPPPGSWEILVQDTDHDAPCYLTLAEGWAVATSSTQKRRWSHRGQNVIHVLDPRWGIPVVPHWRTASVVAPTALEANSLSTAALVKGTEALQWLREQGLPARLVAANGRVHTLGSWPEEVQHHG